MPEMDKISDLEEEGKEGDAEAEIENEAALLNFSAILSKAQEIATPSARSKEQSAKRLNITLSI